MKCSKYEFLEHVKGHHMEILKDDGLYRHLKFTDGGSQVYRFDLITWPGHLCICQDMGTYVFSRVADMFDFFYKGKIAINPYYWSEKVQSQCKQSHIEQYSQEELIENVWYWFENYFEFKDDEEKEAVKEEINNEVIGSLSGCEIRDYDLVVDFESSFGHVFLDFFEANNEEYTYHYLWCCWAIVWGIAQYKKSKASN